MSVTPRHSVVIPTYSRPEFLNEAVESVLNQTCDNLECVVADDASDEPPELPADPRVRLVRRDRNGGPGAARATGQDACRGEFVSFLDDDDRYTVDRLEMVDDLLAEWPAVLTLIARMTDPATPSDLSRHLEGDVSDQILTEPIPHVGCVTIRRDLVPRFDETYVTTEDGEWWLRVALAVTITTVPRVGYLYRTHSGARQTGRLEDRLTGRLQLLDQHGEFFDEHRRAAAYQWRRAGGISLAMGDRRGARRAFRRSLAARPTARSAVHLALASVPRLS